MGRKSNRHMKSAGKKSEKIHKQDGIFREEDIDDEIDAFHKQRDVVPLDADEDAADSDGEMEQSVFDLKGGEDDSDSSKSDGEEEEEDDQQLKGFAAKIARQAKYLRQKFGVVDDEMDDDDIEEDDKRTAWGGKKNLYYSADNVNAEHDSSDEEHEEAEAVRIQKEKAKNLSMEDFGLEDADEVASDTEKAFQDTFAGKKTVPERNVDAVLLDGPFDNYEEVTKDLSALSKEEQMEVVNSSAPELVNLLTELDKAHNQLKEVKTLLSKVVKETKDIPKGVTKYFEVKQILLLSYCQAIGFYLLLKSEGHTVRDHPVIARLVEIKNLLDKLEHIDRNLNFPPQIEEIANLQTDPSVRLAQEVVPMEAEPNMITAPAGPSETAEANELSELVKDGLSEDIISKSASTDLQVGLQSKEMLKVRANLEAKLKKKGIYNSNSKSERTQNHATKPVNKRLETLDDFDDEVQLNAKRRCESNGHSSLSHLIKPIQLVTSKVKKPKFVSGDDDLPKRDDIGERRRKFELRVLSRAGAESVGDGDIDMKDEEDDVKETMPPDATAEDGEELESEDKSYKQIMEQRNEKLMAKDQLSSRTPVLPNEPLEIEEDGKRQITYQMEKNRGLTRHRKKLLKNPRKKYKIKHQKAVIRRKGQVRDIRKPAGPYGGEATGVNINVSRSIRFKN